MASISLDFRTNNGIVIEGVGIATSSTYAKNGLQVAGGGAAIGKNLIVGSTATIWGDSHLYGALDVDGITRINNNTAGGNLAGALQVTGGAYLGNNLYIAGTETSSVNTNSNSIFTQGGLGVARDGSFGGNLVVTGNFTVLGTQTIINSTSTAIQDPVIDIGTGPNNSPLVGNDGYNKGIVIHYYDTDDNHMFVGRNNTTGHLVIRHNMDPGYSGEIPNADYINSGTYATLDLLDLLSHGTDDSFSGITGAIQTEGGLGVTKAIYAGSTMTAATVFSRNLSTDRVVLGTVGGQLTDNANLTWNTGASRLEGTITYANTATHVAGGSYGNLLYQTGTNQTGFIENGFADQILTFDGTKPVWTVPTGLSAGNATTATNIKGGLAGEIPYQVQPGITVFDANFTWSTATDTLSALNITVPGTTNSTSTTTGALHVAGGVSIEKDLWLGGSMYVAGDIFLDGVGLDTVSGTTATFLNVNVTGTGVALFVNDSAIVGGTLTTTNLVVTGSASIPGGITATNFTTTVLTVIGPTVLAQLSAALTTLTQLTVTGDASVGGTFTVTGQTTLAGVVGTTAQFDTLHLTNTATSTSTTSGALVVDGGVGIAKDVFIGGTTNLQNTVITVLTATTANITNLAVTNTGTFGNVSVAGVVATNTLTATSATIVDLIVSSSITIGGTGFSASGGISSTGTSAFGAITAELATVTNLTVTNNETVGNNLLVGNLFTATTANVTGQLTTDHLSVSTTATIGGRVNLLNDSNAVATNNASFITAGGIGVAKDAFVGGALNVGEISTATVVPALYTNNVLLASYTSPSISGTTIQNLDTYSAVTYRTAKYFVQIADGSDVHVTEITLFHDGATVYKNEYAIATNNGELGTFDATLLANVITLNFTPVGASAMVIKVVRLGLTA